MTPADREEMLQTISDLSKEAYGFRVRKDWASLSDEELQSDWDQLLNQAHMAMREEDIAALNAQRAWEKRLNSMVTDYSISFETALRWDMEAMEVDGDYGYYCFKLGLSYDLEKRMSQAK